MKQATDLRNKHVVVLGGSSGIRFAVAEHASTQGASIVVASSNPERIQKAVEKLEGNAQGYTLDLSDESSVENFFATLGAFDHLVFTAGDSLHLHDLATTDLKQARRAFELRYWAALSAVKYGTTNIRKGGSIVLTTGVAGQRPHKGWGCYRQCLRNDRSPDTSPCAGVGADSRERSVSRSCSDEPLAEHACARTGTPV